MEISSPAHLLYSPSAVPRSATWGVGVDKNEVMIDHKPVNLLVLGFVASHYLEHPSTHELPKNGSGSINIEPLTNKVFDDVNLLIHRLEGTGVLYFAMF